MEGAVLECWYIGGRRRFLKPPFKPFFYSKYPSYQSLPVKKRLLSNPKVEVEVWKRDFFDTRKLIAERNRDSMHATTPFVHVVAENIGFKSPSQLPKVLTFDCESIVDGISPNPILDRLRSIACWDITHQEFFDGLNKNALNALDIPDLPRYPVWVVGDKETPKIRDVLKAFRNYVRLNDPDIIAGANSSGYDFPLILQECNRASFQMRLGRDNSVPYIRIREYERRGKVRENRKVRIGGRVHFDVLDEVHFDQNPDFYDFKRRGLFNVARYFGFNPIVISHIDLPDDKVAQVNLDDARCTYGVSWIYLSGLCELAEIMEVPLNMVIERYPSHVPNWLFGREFNKLGIISDGPNKDRFKEIFSGKKKAYQGGFVRCYRIGLFKNIIHIDFTSMYPSIMIMANLSPETVFLIELKPYTGEYHFADDGDYAIIEVPDANLKKQVVCRVYMASDSVARGKLMEFRNVRAELKAAFKKSKDASLKSRQWAYKILQNVVYGYNGLQFARYGNVLVALLTTALGRLFIQNKVHELEKQGKIVIQVDTDGLYIGEPVA